MSRRPPPPPRDLAGLVAEHLKELEARGYAGATLATRGLHLQRFAVWCEERGITRATEITPATLEQYRRTLFHHRQADGRPLAWSTQSGRLTALRMLLKWLTRTGALLYNPAAELELPRQRQKLPKAVLSVAEAEAVLGQPDLTTPLDSGTGRFSRCSTRPRFAGASGPSAGSRSTWTKHGHVWRGARTPAPSS